MATNTFATSQEIDPITGKPKKQQSATVLPRQDVNNPSSDVQLSKSSMGGGAATAGNESVLRTAQNSVLQQGNQPSQLQTATTNATMDFLNNPMGDYDPAKTKQGKLEKADTDWAKSFEATRRKYGNIAGSGIAQQDSILNQLNHNVDMRDYEGQIDTDNYNKYVDSLTKSIAAGQSVNQGNENVFSQRLNNLGAVRSMAEPERQQTQATSDALKLGEVQQGYDIEKIKLGQAGEQALQQKGFDQQTIRDATLQGYDLSKLKTTQDFAAMSQEVANKQALALQANDAVTAEKLAVLKGKIDAEAQKQGQLNAIQLQNLGYDQQVQLNAQAQGYDLERLDKVFGNETTKLIMSTNLDTEAKKSLMELQDKFDTGKLVKTQDFEAVQNSIDRLFKEASDVRNIEAATNLEKLRGEINLKAQDAADNQAYYRQQASQNWQTGERKSAEENAKVMEYLKQAHADAVQNKDIDAQKDIANLQAKNQLAMQTNEMGQEEKMAYIQSQLRQAEADGDMSRQREILDFTYGQEIRKMVEADGLERSRIVLQGDIERALNEGNYTHAETMQQTLLQEQARQAKLDRAVETARTQLQAKGVDLQAQSAEWEQLKAGVESGAVSPDALTQYLQAKGDEFGIEIEPADPMAEYAETRKMFDGLKAQFGMTHPEYVIDSATGQLTDAGAKAFNDFYNKQMYNSTAGGDANKAQKETAAVQSYLKDYATSLGNPAAFAGKQIGEVISNPGKAVDKAKDAFDWLKGLVK